MSGKSIEAGRAFLRLLIEDKAFKSGLDNSLRQLDAFGKGAMRVGAQIGAVGAAITAPFVASLKIFSDVGSELTDMATRTGLSVNALSELKYAAGQTGSSLGQVEGAVRRMQRSLTDAATNGGAAAATFKRLGLSVSELQGLTPDEQFNRVARAIGAVKDPTERAALAMKVFGKSGTQLLPLIAEMDTLRDKARALGLTWTDEMAASADKVGDSIDTLKASFVAVAVAIAEAVAPAVVKVAEGLAKTAKHVIDFIRNNKNLTSAAFSLGVALTVLGTVVGGVGVAMRATAAAVATLRASLTLLSRHPYLVAFTVLAAAVTALAAKLGVFGEAADDSAESLNDVGSAASGAAAAQSELADGIDEGTAAFDKRAEAIKRLSERERELVEEVEKATQERDVTQTEKELRQLARVQQILRSIAAIRGGAVYQTIGDTAETGKKRMEEVLRKRIAELDQAIGGAFSLFGLLNVATVGAAAGSPARDDTRGRNIPTSTGRGRRGFDTGPQNKKDFEKESRHILSTFNARTAGQLFGGGKTDQVVTRIEKMIAEQIKGNKKLENIDRNLQRSQVFVVGNV